jgi:small subunit ribosomal protein S1
MSEKTKKKTAAKPKVKDKATATKAKSSAKAKKETKTASTKVKTAKKAAVKTTAATMEELLAKHPVQIKSYRQGELVEGTVVSINPSNILLDIGAKAEGLVKKSQMGDSENSYKSLKVGDTILVMVERDENKQGFIELSLKKAENERKWKDFEDMFNSQTQFEVTALQYNKGGLICDAMGMQGFVPISHLDSSRFAEVSKQAKGSERDIEERMAPLIGQGLKVIIIELDREQNRLVLSEKLRDAEKVKKQKEDRLSEIKVGEKIDGIVSGVVPFGLFVDLDGVEGLVHVSEIAWEKVENPSTYYNVGDKITAEVIDIDENRGKVGLSLKRLVENPWEKVAEKYPENTKVKGTVTRVVAFGAFIEIEKGLEGLVHVSEMAEELKEGQKVEAVVTIVDPNEQRLGLSTRKVGEKTMIR